MQLDEAVAAFTAGVDALLAADVDSPSHRDLLTSFAAIQRTSRRIPLAGYAMLARLDREADPKTLGGTSLRTVSRAPLPDEHPARSAVR